MMLSLHNNDEAKETYLVIVLEKDNLRRMRRSDPVTIETEAQGGVLPVAKYPEKLMMLIAYEEDEDELYKIVRTGGLPELIKYVRRGYHWDRDTDGTHRAFSLFKGDQRR